MDELDKMILASVYGARYTALVAARVFPTREDAARAAGVFAMEALRFFHEVGGTSQSLPHSHRAQQR